jgi:DNA/RNA-binding domain of Phe-tRNA-synthetase-like protein
MVAVTIDQSITSSVPALKLGLIETSELIMPDNSDELWQDLQRLGDEVREAVGDLAGLAARAEVVAVRDAYRALGKDPSRYRGSAEALVRRQIQGKGLYRVNPLVDLNNYISLLSLCPVGSYDLDNIQGSVCFREGLPGESFVGIGKSTINLEGLPVFCDDLGPFGSPTSDSERTMITQNTGRALTVIISFGASVYPLDWLLEEGRALFVKYLGVNECTTRKVE